MPLSVTVNSYQHLNFPSSLVIISIKLSLASTNSVNILWPLFIAVLPAVLFRRQFTSFWSRWENFTVIQEPAGYRNVFFSAQEGTCISSTSMCQNAGCFCIHSDSDIFLDFHSEKMLVQNFQKKIHPVNNNLLRHSGRIMFNYGPGKECTVTTQSGEIEMS